ncbi:cAMP phosphodiesterases class-II-domain-containing protein [Lineolata rhizophorae]|uniref:cAMP phosphodiesterases class-II-domain-containing protein n=1 Tax=Lineolata rhizophorae TaxID=578093 RepID=A0A6A6PDX9_9PEZI|nr:cAMP phosphodiesterases class-II-domain-containing protein [Lineolata rhizophorae]
MKERDGLGGQARRGSHAAEPAIHVICLGSGGGPSEDNVTGFLVRATSSRWSRGSVLAVDAGTHLSAITRILERDFPLVADSPRPESHSNESPQVTITTLQSGPFAGLPFPNASARANAVHVVREHVSTYLITHPHLDHLSGFVINTAAFHNTSRPKRLAALPFTVNAIKAHLFNDLIWPNLSDEDGGVGFVTFQRLAEGGNIALGEGHGRGYIEVCEGLSVKGFKVSHGNCMRASSCMHRGSNPNIQEHMQHSVSLAHSHSQPGSLSAPGQGASGAGPREGRVPCVIDSTAYFIRAEGTSSSTSSASSTHGHHSHAREILIFGDVEPDAVSLSPRTAHVWAEAAPKIAAGILRGLFIECSYTDAQADAVLFGHLAPRHLVHELAALADLVADERRRLAAERGRKRKRASTGAASMPDAPTPSPGPPGANRTWPTMAAAQETTAQTNKLPPPREPLPPPLAGLRVVIIHVKDTLADGRPVGETILAELEAYKEQLEREGRALGCDFVVSKSGEGYWF